MKLKTQEIRDFFLKINENITLKNICAILVYGPDLGGVEIIKNELIKKLLPDYKENKFSLVKYKYDDIKENKNIIFNEYISSQLFSSTRKVIIIEETGNNEIKSDICEIFDIIFDYPKKSKNILILVAGNLGSKDKTRILFEKSEYAITYPCYSEDQTQIQNIIERKLNEYKFNYNLETLKYLVSSFDGDKLILLNEIDKLAIYKGDNKNLTIDDVMLCIQDNSSANFNKFKNSIASMDYSTAYKELQNIYLSDKQNTPQKIIGILVKYFQNLQLWKYQIQKGVEYEEIAKKNNIFWKEKNIIANQLKNLSLDRINNILFILYKIRCKLQGKIY